MAKYKFTKKQFDDISVLLKRRLTENRTEQKKTRGKIRKLGFMISDYKTGFTDLDFKKLLVSKEIEITTSGNVIKLPSTKTNKTTTTNKTKIVKTLDKTKKALPAVVDGNTECLVLGTMPGEQSLMNQEYYRNSNNKFWDIISIIFNDGNSFSNYEEKVETLKENRIGLWDVLDTCEREGSLDSNIKNHTINNFEKFFKKYPNIITVIFNGQDSHNYFKPVFKSESDKQYFQLSSTSSVNKHKTIEEKINEWKDALTRKTKLPLT